MAQSLVGSLLLSLRFWYAQSFSCPFQECFPSPLEILHQIPLVFKVKFPEGSQSLCWIPRLGNVLWALEHLQQCENFFDIIVLQFEGLLLGESMVGLMMTSSKRIYATCSASRVCCSQSPHPHGSPYWSVTLQETLTQRQMWFYLL